MRLVVLDASENGPNLQRHGPEELLAFVRGEEAGVRFCPKDGVALLRWGPVRSSGGGALLGQTRKFVHQFYDAELRFCKKSWPADIFKISLRYLSAVLLFFIKDRSSRWAAKYRQ